MVSPSLLTFVSSRGWTSLSGWARAARLPPNVLHMGRKRGRLPEEHLRALALAAGVGAERVRALLFASEAS